MIWDKIWKLMDIGIIKYKKLFICKYLLVFIHSFSRILLLLIGLRKERREKRDNRNYNSYRKKRKIEKNNFSQRKKKILYNKKKFYLLFI
jgi:hypothetical protein